MQITFGRFQPKRSIVLLIGFVALCMGTFTISYPARGALLKTERQNAQTAPEASAALRALECQLDQAKGKDATAAEACLKALGVEPISASDFNNRGWSRLNSQRAEEALKDFETALAIEPTYRKARGNRIWALMALHRYDEAIADLDGLLKEEPQNRPGLLNDRCNFLLQKRDFEQARTTCIEAVGLLPDDWVAHFRLGQAQAALGDLAAARTAFDLAIDLDDEYRDARVARARAATAQQDAPSAISDWEWLLEKNPNDPDALLYYPQLACTGGVDANRVFRVSQRAVEEFPLDIAVLWRGFRASVAADDRTVAAFLLQKLHAISPQRMKAPWTGRSFDELANCKVLVDLGE